MAMTAGLKQEGNEAGHGTEEWVWSTCAGGGDSKCKAFNVGKNKSIQHMEQCGQSLLC